MRAPLPDDVHAAIAQALRALAVTEARNVQVTVDGRTVTLAGKVGSRAEYQAVVRAAIATPGVRVVDDYMLVFEQ